MLAVLAILTRGTDGLVTAALHGAAEPSEQMPPVGGAAVAVLVTTAGRPLLAAVAWIVYVTTPPAGKVASVSLSAPLPLALGHAAPPLAAQVHVALAMPVGSVSLTLVPDALTVPVLVAVTV